MKVVILTGGMGTRIAEESQLDITALITFHRRHGRLATVTAVAPPGRYGALLMQDNRVTRFSEKPPATLR
jgi:NDP-sugar pyrophosphorylase family protein